MPASTLSGRSVALLRVQLDNCTPSEGQLILTETAQEPIKALRSLDVCLSGMQLRKDLAGGVASGESSFEEAAKPFPALLIEITGQAAV
jgi:hypothetical protein